MYVTGSLEVVKRVICEESEFPSEVFHYMIEYLRYFSWFCFVCHNFVVLEMEPRAWYMLGKPSTFELWPPP
jgi:hypothetical protein